jgi:glycosyltransferase involved in cell wall biosynthesis
VQPLFSIITVVFNDAINLEKTILNVLEQDFKNFQYIVIDGASNDNTLEVISKYSNWIDIVVSESDQGIYDAMNKGVKYADGKWINFLNAGDTYESKNFLSILASQILEPHVNLIYTDCKIGGKVYSPLLNRKYLIRNMICHQSLFYRSNLFDEYQYDLSFKICADFSHLVSIYDKLVCFKITGISVIYLGGGVSENSENKSVLLDERLNVVLNSKFNFWYKVVFYFVNRAQFILNRF